MSKMIQLRNVPNALQRAWKVALPWQVCRFRLIC